MDYFRLFIFIIFHLYQMSSAQISLSSIPCSILNQRSGRVVGGTDANRNQLPFMVSLRRRGGHFCGASILNERWLLTAGHCMCNGLNRIMKPNQINAVLGLHRISEHSDISNGINYDHPNTAIQIGFKNIIVHGNYDCSKPDNDIALLEMDESITFNDAIQPTCIASSAVTNHSYDGIAAIVSGWGWTDENQDVGERADTLQAATIRVWNNEKCQISYNEQKKPHFIKYTQLCAGTNGIDSCWADSGGPLTSIDNVQIGVVSTGVGCARPGLPGIYTRVSEYANWIKSIAVLNS